MWQGLMDSVLHIHIHILHVHKHMVTFIHSRGTLST